MAVCMGTNPHCCSIPGGRAGQHGTPPEEVSSLANAPVGCSKSIPARSIPARPHHGHCADQVAVCCNAQLAPSPLWGTHSSEIVILAPWETLNCFNLSEYLIPRLANGSAGVGDVLASVPSETSSKNCQVSVPQACLLTGAMTPACPTM